MKINKVSDLNSRSWRSLGQSALLLAFMVTGLFLSACATQAPESREISIAERAQQRWDTLLAGDLEAAYEFYSPGYRSSTSLIDFAFGIRSRRVHWTTAQYKEHSCLEQSCTVIFEVGFTVAMPVPGLTKWDGNDTLEEKWVKTGGHWWYLPNK